MNFCVYKDNPLNIVSYLFSVWSFFVSSFNSPLFLFSPKKKRKEAKKQKCIIDLNDISRYTLFNPRSFQHPLFISTCHPFLYYYFFFLFTVSLLHFSHFLYLFFFFSFFFYLKLIKFYVDY